MGLSKAAAKVFKKSRLPPPPHRSVAAAIKAEDNESGPSNTAVLKKKRQRYRVPYKVGRLRTRGEDAAPWAYATRHRCTRVPVSFREWQASVSLSLSSLTPAALYYA